MMKERLSKLNLKGKEVKGMKKILVIFAVIGIVCALGSTTYAVQNYITFNDPTSGDSIQVYSFDWDVGNALGYDSVPAAGLPAFQDLNGDLIPDNTHPFTLYYQARLANFKDLSGPIGGTGLNVAGGYEVTIIAAFGEVGWVEGRTAKFAFDPTNTTSYVYMYIDTARNANDLTGTGFTDGTLLMSGQIVATDFGDSYRTGGSFSVDSGTPLTTLNVAQFDQFGFNNWPGIGTVTGSGDTRAVADIDPNSVDGTYFDPSAPFLLWLQFLTDTNQLDPFFQTDPSQKFWDAIAGAFVVPTFGNCTGTPPFACEANSFSLVNGSSKTGTTVDFQFQTDANSAVRLVQTPEPASILLIGTGLLGFAIGMRRRRK